jgi:hypothetical protein
VCIFIIQYTYFFAAPQVGNEYNMPKISSIAGNRKLRKKLMPQPEAAKTTDLNVVGFEVNNHVLSLQL